MRGQGHQIFAAALSRCAAGSGTLADRRLAPLARRVAAPLRVAVHGRPGVGAGTVRAALVAAGSIVADADADADVSIRVVAEVAKPEDLAKPATLVVLNKADLTGFRTGGPIAAAHRRATELAARIGAPTEPMVALLAVAALDDAVLDQELLDALRVLVDEPADLRSPDAFVDGSHRLAPALRRRLVDSLDIFGIAHAVVVLRTHATADAAAVRAELRRVSRIDDVTGRIEALAAQTRYRRVLDVIGELEALAITDAGVAAFLTAYDTVLARMATAVDVVEADGLTVDPADDPAAHLRRAVHWRRYGAGPVAAVHRACADDIARGSLRLLAAAAAQAGSP
jgi:hypothetical protein